jgi:hypothetical protein
MVRRAAAAAAESSESSESVSCSLRTPLVVTLYANTFDLCAIQLLHLHARHSEINNRCFRFLGCCGNYVQDSAEEEDWKHTNNSTKKFNATRYHEYKRHVGKDKVCVWERRVERVRERVRREEREIYIKGKRKRERERE